MAYILLEDMVNTHFVPSPYIRHCTITTIVSLGKYVLHNTVGMVFPSDQR